MCASSFPAWNSLWKNANNLAWVHSFFDCYHTWTNSEAEYLKPNSPWRSDPSSDTFGKKAHKSTPTRRSELNHLCQVMTHLSIFSWSWALSSGGSYRIRAPSSKGSWRGLLSPARLIPSARKPSGPESKQRHNSKNNFFLKESRALQKCLITFRNSELIGCWSGDAGTTSADSKPTQGGCLAALCQHTVGSSAAGKNRMKEQRQRWSNGTARHIGCTKMGTTGCSRCHIGWHTTV